MSDVVTATKNLTTGMAPAWSPTRNGPGQQVAVQPPAGQQQQQQPQLGADGKPIPAAGAKPTIDTFGDMWLPPKPAATQTADGKPIAPGSTVIVQQTTPAVVPKDHFETILYYNGIDMHKGVAALQSGDVEQIGGFFKDMAKWLHKTMARDALQLAEHYAKQAEDRAVSTSTNRQQTSMAYEALYEAVPAFRHPALSPMARATFDQMIKKGETVDGAILKTKEFFQAMTDRMGEVFREGQPPPNAPGSNNLFQHSNGFSVDKKTGEAVDFEAVFQ